MSDSDNLYQSPQTDVNAVNPLAPTGRLTEAMILYLKGASPWLRFLGIFSFITTGAMVLGGVLITVAGFLGSGFLAEMLTSEDMGIAGGVITVMGIFVIIIGVICFFPARFTYNFGKKIKNFLQNNSPEELELAFKNNKSLWKFIGIVTIIYLAFVPVMTIVSIIVALSAAL